MPPKSGSDLIGKDEIAERLTQSVWKCVWVKDYATTSLWRTSAGFYFSVPHECTEAQFENEIADDLRKNGWKRNV